MATRKITSLDQFALAVNTAGKGFTTEIQKAIAKATVKVQSDAIKKFGTYQPEVGPFNEWPQLAEATLKEKYKAGSQGDDPLIGHYPNGKKNPLYPAPLRNSILSQVKGFYGIVGTNNPLGKWHEFGHPKLPARPFLRPALWENRDQIKTWIKEAIAIALSKY